MNEYKTRLLSMDLPNDYLTSEDLSELRKDIKEEHGIILKEFNGKATIKEMNDCYILQSYYTDVCSIDFNGNFKKLWNGYSATTLRQVNAFRRLHNLQALNKKEWVLMEVE